MTISKLPISPATVRRLTAHPGTALKADEITRLEQAGWLTPYEVAFLKNTAHLHAGNFARRRSLTQKQLSIRLEINALVLQRAEREAGRDE